MNKQTPQWTNKQTTFTSQPNNKQPRPTNAVPQSNKQASTQTHQQASKLKTSKHKTTQTNILVIWTQRKHESICKMQAQAKPQCQTQMRNIQHEASERL
jgi:hypothetical protein